MKKLGIVAATAAIFVGVPAHAELLSTYAPTCAQALGLTTIPGYSCSQGTLLASGQGLFVLPNLNNNWLGRVSTSNPNVDAMFLCRGTSGGSTSTNGYILQNTVTGMTCFFDARSGQSSTVPNPTSSGADSIWSNPNEMADPCQRCHSADPFITSPVLAPAMKTQNMIRRGRNLRGAYNIVSSASGGSHFFDWDAQRQLVSNSGCALACHNTSNNSGPASWFSQAVSGGWMPPPANQAFVPPAETPSSIAVWRPGSPATFFFDRDGNHAWNAGDQSGFFGETGDKPFVMRGSDCSDPNKQRAEFGTTRGNTWLLTNNNHFWDSPTDDQNTFTYGNGDPYSWNGIAVNFQSSSFGIDYNNNRNTNGDLSFPFGTTGDKPVVGRWKEGIAYRMGIYRAVGGQGFFALETNGNNVWDSGDTSFQFGLATDIPFAGDFNGDGRDEVGVFRDGSWFVDMNNTFQWDAGDEEWFFGQAGDIPVVTPGKWNCAW